MLTETAWLLDKIREMHDAMRARIVDACQSRNFDDMAAGRQAGAGDVIYPVDRAGEQELLDFVAREIAPQQPIVVVGEGIAGGQVALPADVAADEARWRMIVDPIDGTRGLMYQKRSAWILTGVAPNHGEKTHLGHIELAVQTEIPTLKQHLCDQLWAIRGKGARALRVNRLTGQSESVPTTPSLSTTLQDGYATVCRFFPGGRDLLARIDDQLIERLLGPRTPDLNDVFEDQYACTAGQLYGLTMGQDRFVADLRPLLKSVLDRRGEILGHCCHPYDVATALIAEEAGVTVCAPRGGPLRDPLDTTTNVAWVGYANRHLQKQIEPLLIELLEEAGLR